MATHVEVVHKHGGVVARAEEILDAVEVHLGIRGARTDAGRHFEFPDHQRVDDAGRDLSSALDTVAHDWRDHLEMGF
jgi:hypothetical protein